MGLVVAGHAALGGGRLRDASFLLREAWAGLAHSGHEFRFRCRTLLATALWQTAVQFGDATAALPRLTALADLGPRAMVASAHARAWAGEDGDALLKAADEWTRLGDSSPPATQRPRRPTYIVGRGGMVQPSPPPPWPRSSPAGPAPGPRRWRSRSDRCR